MISCNSTAALKEDEIARIKYEATGCFGSSEYTIVFFRRGEKTFAQVQDTERDEVTRIHEVRRETLDSVIASLSRLKKGSGCTSWTRYTIQTKSDKFVREDEICQDAGFSVLLGEIYENPD